MVGLGVPGIYIYIHTYTLDLDRGFLVAPPLEQRSPASGARPRSQLAFQ